MYYFHKFLLLSAALAFTGTFLPSCSSPSAPSSSNIPQDAQNLVLKAQNKLDRGDYKSCVEDVSEALSIYSDYADAYARRGICRFGLGDNNGAIEDVELAANIAERKGVSAKAEAYKKIAQEFKGTSGKLESLSSNPSEGQNPPSITDPKDDEFLRSANSEYYIIYSSFSPLWQKLSRDEQIALGKAACKWESGESPNSLIIRYMGGAPTSFNQFDETMGYTEVIRTGLSVYCPNKLQPWIEALATEALQNLK